MILKYKVPLPYRQYFANKKNIYCKILKETDEEVQERKAIQNEQNYNYDFGELPF